MICYKCITANGKTICLYPQYLHVKGKLPGVEEIIKYIDIIK